MEDVIAPVSPSGRNSRGTALWIGGRLCGVCIYAAAGVVVWCDRRAGVGGLMRDEVFESR